MKAICTGLVLLVAVTRSLAAPSSQDSVFARKVLEEAQARIRNTHTLTYHSDYRQVSSGLEDSVFAVSGTIWLERIPTDTIFGYRFHLRGVSPSAFDYYYDGKTSREFRHEEKEITEFNPYEDNSPHSPAKARVALVPVLPLETDTSLAGDLLQHCAGVTLADSGRAWVITLVYRADSFGQLVTKRVWVDKDTYRVTALEVKGSFNGTHYSQNIRVSDLAPDVPGTRDSIPERGVYAYQTPHWVKPAPPKPSPLEGAMASDFAYTSFDGQPVRLSALRGRYVLLDFWESWCGWCIEAFPHLSTLDSLYAGKPFTLLAVVTENLTQVKEIVDNNRLRYSTLRGDARVIKDYQVEGRPTYVLIDPAGKIIAYAPGDLDRVKALLRQRLP